MQIFSLRNEEMMTSILSRVSNGQPMASPQSRLFLKLKWASRSKP
jgi:hypothetical protein